MVFCDVLQMENPSKANDEGITALHNSICAGHFDIVKFLVEFGCDVNAADTDGWFVWLCSVSYNYVPIWPVMHSVPSVCLRVCLSVLFML